MPATDDDAAGLIYLDHAATTPLRPEALEAMEPYLTTQYGNPSGAHSMARVARRAVDDARERVAAVLACEPGEVIFTSGGTEADNLAVTGTVLHALAGGAEAPLACCSAVEHPGVLEPVRYLGGIELPVDSDGVVDLDLLHAVLEVEAARIALVSVMAVNNETGVIEPIDEIVELCRMVVPDALVHTDGVQALSSMDLAELSSAVDLVTVSAHKIGGPKGTGALVARRGARARLAPVLRGGPQERELRAGTPDVAGIVGFATAAELALSESVAETERVAELADRLLAGILDGVAGALPAVEKARRVASIVNVFVPGAPAEEVLLLLDQAGVCASSGSSCASGATEPSHVLLAMGRDAETARRHLRLSLGRTTTAAEVDEAIRAVVAAAGSATPI